MKPVSTVTSSPTLIVLSWPVLLLIKLGRSKSGREKKDRIVIMYLPLSKPGNIPVETGEEDGAPSDPIGS